MPMLPPRTLHDQPDRSHSPAELSGGDEQVMSMSELLGGLSLGDSIDDEYRMNACSDRRLCLRVYFGRTVPYNSQDVHHAPHNRGQQMVVPRRTSPSPSPPQHRSPPLLVLDRIPLPAPRERRRRTALPAMHVRHRRRSTCPPSFCLPTLTAAEAGARCGRGRGVVPAPRRTTPLRRRRRRSPLSRVLQPPVDDR